VFAADPEDFDAASDAAPDVLRGVVEARSDHVVVHVHVQPRSGRNAVVGRHGDALKVRVTAAPVADAANEAVGRLLAAELGLPSRCVTLESGGSSRAKRFRVQGLDAGDVRARLAEVVGRSARNA
jgi:uncharacterized protein (TIGR00251 family)